MGNSYLALRLELTGQDIKEIMYVSQSTLPSLPDEMFD